MNFKFLISIFFLSFFFIACTVKDEIECVNSFDCPAGYSCIDAVCMDQQEVVSDSGNTPDTQESISDNSQNDNSTSTDNNTTDKETNDNTVSDQETSDKSELNDNSTVPDEAVDNNENPDETPDSATDATPDEIPDETTDETPDIDNSTAITCSTLTCGTNAHCEDYTGTAKCVCDSFYQDEDNNGTCLETCTLFDCNETAWGAFNNCSIINGAPVCSCDSFAGYTGNHCTECRSDYHAGGFGYEDECFEDNCEEAQDNFHGWLDCWGSQECRDNFGYAECW